MARSLIGSHPNARKWGVRSTVTSVGLSFALAIIPGAPAMASNAVPAEAQVAQVVAVFTQPQAMAKQAMAVQARSQGASSDQIDSILSPASSGCWGGGGYVYAVNTLGQKLWQYNESHDWCGGGVYITYTSVSTWPSNTYIGWSYEGDTKSSTYGVGWNVWKELLSGHFCLIPYLGCIDNSYPWIQYEVGGGGQQYFWNGGF